MSRPHLPRFKAAMAAPVAGHDNESLIREYLEWKGSYAQRASEMYEIWVRRFQTFTNKAPEALTLGDWTAFARSLNGRFAPKSVEYALNIIHNLLRFWHEQGRLRHLPLYLVRVPKAMAESHAAISEDEYLRMVETLKRQGRKALRDLAILMLLHDTGMRVGELVSLEIEQIDEDCSATIHTEKTVRRRQVFWNEATDHVLHEFIVERVNQHASSDYLFTRRELGEGQKPLTTRGVQHLMRRACKAAGISRRLSPHSFRHAYIHRLARLSVPDAIIAQLVGHSTPFTISHYTKLSRPEAEEFARRQFAGLALAA